MDVDYRGREARLARSQSSAVFYQSQIRSMSALFGFKISITPPGVLVLSKPELVPSLTAPNVKHVLSKWFSWMFSHWKLVRDLQSCYISTSRPFLYFQRDTFRFVSLTLWHLCFFPRRLGVELGKSLVYQEPNRGTAEQWPHCSRLHKCL